jgi:cold shock CspA family protein
MKPACWTCVTCESLNPGTTDICETCSLKREPGELAGTGHLRHLIASLKNKSSWRIANVGPGRVEIAARSRTAAEIHGKALLAQNAYPDQSVTVISARSRGWLVYVELTLTPYPTSLHPRQACTPRKLPPDVSLTARTPTEGRMYLGHVTVWFSDKGYGTIACANRRIGNIKVRRSDLAGGREDILRAGQNVCFYIERTSDGLFAVDVMAL